MGCRGSRNGVRSTPYQCPLKLASSTSIMLTCTIPVTSNLSNCRAKECFNTVQDMIKCNATLLKEDSSEFKRFVQDLDALMIFCTADDEDIPADHYDGSPLGYHQNILADLRIEDALMEFVSLPFQKGSENNEWAIVREQSWAKVLPGMLAYNKLVRKSFRVMRQMCKGNMHNSYVTAMKFKIPMTNSCKLASKLAFKPGYEFKRTIPNITIKSKPK